MAPPDSLKKVVRKTARSGKVDFSRTVVLNETSRSRLQAMAWFIPRSEGTEFQLKLEGFRISKDRPWEVDKEKTLNLSETACLQLIEFIRTHLPVAEQSQAGEFIMLRVADGVAELGGHEPQDVVAALMTVLGQKELVSHLAGVELSQELTSALRSSMKLAEMRSAVAELRARLETGDASEVTYQKWCENHCWAFGNAYFGHDLVRSISTGDQIDLLLPGVIAGFRDIVELKRPDKEVLLYDDAHKNYYFSSEVSKAVGQCHRYLDILQELAKNGLLDHKEVVAYHPRATIVIGRSVDWSDDRQRALHGLNQRLHGVSVMTYDHLLAQGERLVDLMSPEHFDDGAAAHQVEDNDDIPW